VPGGARKEEIPEHVDGCALLAFASRCGSPRAGRRSGSLERRLAIGEVAGSPLAPANAWLIIALASGDPIFQAQVMDTVRPAMLPRLRARLEQEGLLALAPRLRRRAILRQLTVSSARAADLSTDAALVRTGPSAASAYDWSGLDGLPLDVYVPPPRTRCSGRPGTYTRSPPSR
jgi:hypothetical protein